MMLKQKIWLMLGLVIVLGIALRLRNFWLPPIDAHPMRQTDTECVAYFMANGQASLLYPKNCFMRPVTNNEGYFMLEIPFYQAILAASYKLANFSIAGPRLVNLGLYVIAAVSVFVFVSNIFNKKIGLVSCLLFSLTPSSIFFLGHAIHPDVFAVATMALSLAILSKPFGTSTSSVPFGTIRLIISGVLLGISVATRPFGLIVLPVYLWILYKTKARWWQYGLLVFLSLIFYGLWRLWVISVGVNADWENWVLGGREKLLNWGYFKNFFVKNVIGEIMGKVISGLVLLGILVGFKSKDRNIWSIIAWVIMIPVYWLIVPNGNLTHQYYGDIYIIPLVILAAIGLVFLVNLNKVLGIVLVLLVIWNGYRTSDYMFKNIIYPEKLVYAREIEENIPEGSKIIYMVKSDSIPVALAHRQGWMLGEWPTDVSPTIWAFMEMRHSDFDYIVEPKGSMDVKREDAVIIEENYPLWKETENLRILKKPEK